MYFNVTLQKTKNIDTTSKWGTEMYDVDFSVNQALVNKFKEDLISKVENNPFIIDSVLLQYGENLFQEPLSIKLHNLVIYTDIDSFINECYTNNTSSPMNKQTLETLLLTKYHVSEPICVTIQKNFVGYPKQAVYSLFNDTDGAIQSESQRCFLSKKHVWRFFSDLRENWKERYGVIDLHNPLLLDLIHWGIIEDRLVQHSSDFDLPSHQQQHYGRRHCNLGVQVIKEITTVDYGTVEAKEKSKGLKISFEHYFEAISEVAKKLHLTKLCPLTNLDTFSVTPIINELMKQIVITKYIYDNAPPGLQEYCAFNLLVKGFYYH